MNLSLTKDRSGSSDEERMDTNERKNCLKLSRASPSVLYFFRVACEISNKKNEMNGRQKRREKNLQLNEKVWIHVEKRKEKKN